MRTPTKGPHRRAWVRRAKAIDAKRAEIAWSVSRWAAEVESKLGEALTLFAHAKLVSRNGSRKVVYGVVMEFENGLDAFEDVLRHPVQGQLDRGSAFEAVLPEIVAIEDDLRLPVEREFVDKTGLLVRRRLTAEDIEDFWLRVRQAAKIVTE